MPVDLTALTHFEGDFETAFKDFLVAADVPAVRERESEVVETPRVAIRFTSDGQTGRARELPGESGVFVEDVWAGRVEFTCRTNRQTNDSSHAAIVGGVRSMMMRWQANFGAVQLPNQRLAHARETGSAQNVEAGEIDATVISYDLRWTLRIA